MKRENYISWEEYFMGIALLSAKRSKDPSTQVGACIVNEDNKIIGIGYNGFPIGISDDEFPWDKHHENELDNKYLYVCHAELNAILNSISNLKNASIYVTLFPCNECSKIIIQSGIKEIIYLEEKGEESISEIASKKMLDAANIKYRKININKEILCVE